MDLDELGLCSNNIVVLLLLSVVSCFVVCAFLQAPTLVQYRGFGIGASENCVRGQ